VLLALVLIGVAGWGSWTVSRPSTFPVRHVQLMGELAHVDQGQLKDRILPHVVHGLLRVDMAALSNSVEELPWVHDAAVRRVWPDVVEVEIHEQKPLARWGNRALVSEEGKLFAPPEPEWPEGLPVFQAPDNTAATVATRYRELREVLAPLGLKVVLLTMNERRAFTLDLENGMRLLLGRSDQQPRLERFVRAYPRVMEGLAPAARQVDLRYTNGFALVRS
jgi:cell division protein FtsQ